MAATQTVERVVPPLPEHVKVCAISCQTIRCETCGYLDCRHLMMKFSIWETICRMCWMKINPE